MIKKRIFMLSILFILLFAVSAVSADENLTATDDETVSLDDETGTFDDLTTEIDAVEDGGTFNLTKNYRYESGPAEGIKINKSITINGNDHQIDGNAQSRIFTTFSGNITLNNLTLINGLADRGGAILAHTPIICNNVVFINNHASEGGAIYSFYDPQLENSLFNISDCVFDANHAERGASIFIAEKPAEPEPDDNESDYGPDDEEIDPEGDGEGYEGEETDPEGDGEDPGDDDEEIPDYTPDKDRIPESEYLISNTIFKNSHDISMGTIYIDTAPIIEINNSTFANSTSDYGTAVFSRFGCFVKCYNNQFMNLHARSSGGAFTFKTLNNMRIENSTFTNVSSDNNGGVICCDMAGWMVDQDYHGQIKINRSEFKNSKARFGGCIVQYGGKLIITDSVFDDNYAISGGAIYAASIKMNITNATFKNNRIDDEGNGGAINQMLGYLNISASRFLNNMKNAVYLCENEYSIENSYFESNTEAIHSLFVKSCFTDNNTYNNDGVNENVTDDDYYVLIISSEGIPLELVRNEFDVENLPSRYDSRDWGWVTPVKNQTISGACWVFSTCAALEAALLKSTGIEYELSVNNIQKNLIAYSKYGLVESTESGDTDIASRFILSWYGAFSKDYEDFDILGKITMPIITSDAVHIQDVLFVTYENTGDIDKIKRTILKYGAIAADLMEGYDAPYFNSETSALYNYDIYASNHAICIVGWDDSYPAGNFLKAPPGNGAWIVKNSYGSSRFDNGYIYVSYYDTSLFYKNNSVAFILENTENYNKNYQTDIGGILTILENMTDYTYKNTYTAIDEDFISAVGTIFVKDEKYTLEIYVNGELKHTQSDVSPFRGFHTVKLTKGIPIRKGDEFTVLIKKSSMPFINETIQHFPKGASLANWGEGWIDLSMLNATATLKVYTKPMADLHPTITAPNVITVYNEGKYLTVTVKDVYGNGMKGVRVTVRLSNGALKTLTTDAKGQARLPVNGLVPKTYTATITTEAIGKYLKTTASAKIIIKKASLKLTAKNKSFKAKTKVKKIRIVLKDRNKKAVKNARITLKVKGKTYSAKTNRKGVALIKITKLTKKGTFKAKVSFKGNACYNAVAKIIKIKNRR